MSEEQVFHRYDSFPASNSRTTVPRITQADAKKLARGCILADERGTTHGNYTIREYLNPGTSERVWIGGDFSEWE